MTVKEIQQALHGLFNNHKYHLYNSFVYNWECDFFSVTKSGNAYECEIKVSRSDFFADFKKEKHQLFQAAWEGKSHFIYRNGSGWYNGTVIGKISNFKIRQEQPVWRMWGKPKSYIEHQEYLHNWPSFHLQKRVSDYHAPCTSISIQPLDKISIPNRFYFVVPEGLIKPEEVPPYAGLIYVNGIGAREIKKAPFIHKRYHDLKAVLLEKFYFETVKLRQQVRYQELQTKERSLLSS